MAKAGPNPFSNGALDFARFTDGETGLIGKIDHGQVKGIAHIHKPLKFFRHIVIEGPSQKIGIIGQNPHRVAVQAGQGRNLAPALVFADFEYGIPGPEPAFRMDAHMIGLSRMSRGMMLKPDPPPGVPDHPVILVLTARRHFPHIREGM